MKSSLRFAIMGCGKIAQRHAMHISNKAVLQSVCDIDIDAAHQLAQQYNVPSYTDIAVMLQQEKPDVVVVCTPNGLHAAHTIQALQAGCHVLCEKPMAIHPDDCRRMIDASVQAGKKILVVKQNRYNPPVVAIKKLLDEGRLGKIYNIQLNCFWNRDADYYAGSWKGTKTLDGGTLYTQFSHFIDLMIWMFGQAEVIHAETRNLGHKDIIEFEDTGMAILRFQSGMLGNVHYTVNSTHKNMEGSLTIFGEKGTVKIGGEYLNVLEYQQIDGYLVPDLPTGNLANNYGKYTGSMSNHGLVYDNFIAVLEKNAAMNINADEAMQTVVLISDLYKKANVE